MNVEIIGYGHHVPDRVVRNEEIEHQLKLEPGWIERRTGIRERHWANANDTLSGLAIAAGDAAINQALIAKSDISLLLLATSTPDHLLPPSAPRVAQELGLKNAGGIDLAGACTGFLCALALGDSFARTQQKPVLVVAANILSRRINMKERASAVLFADAAGAVLLAPTERKTAGLASCDFRSDGDSYDLIAIPGGGSTKPFYDITDPTETLIEIKDGQAVFKKAVALMSDCATAALAQADLTISDIDYAIPHQANGRLIKAVRQNLNLPNEKVHVSVEEYGNSSAATIPLTLSLAHKANAFAPGQSLLLTAAGAGMMGGAIVWKI